MISRSRIKCYWERCRVFFGRGSSFQPGGVFATGGEFCVALASGDFNGDGKPDLAVANTCINGECRNGSVTIELNQGDGTFAATRDL